MFERILYAAESGDREARSFAYVKEIARTHDTEVIVLRVGEVREEQLALAKKHQADLESASASAEAQARVEGHVAAEDVAETLREAGIFARTISRAGRIGEEVLKAADEFDVDMLIIGSAPRTALGALLTGNVTDEIVRKSRRPVLVVPQLGPEDTAQDEG